MDLIDLLEAGNIDKRRIFGKETLFLIHFSSFCEGKTQKENKMEEGMRHLGKEGCDDCFFPFGATENGRKGRTGRS